MKSSVCRGITPESFGSVSITRNPVIASMLFRINYIEQMGAGIMRMKNALRDAGVADPEFELSSFFRVRIRRNAPGQSIAPINQQSIGNR